MKHMLNLLLAAVIAVFCAAFPAGRAQAATVALLPLYNNTENEEAGRIFFVAVLDALKAGGFEDYELIDNDKLNEAIAKNTPEPKLPDAQALKQIAAEGGADIVLAFALEALDDRAYRSQDADYLILDLRGNVTAYNALTGRSYKHRIYSDKMVEDFVAHRWNWLNEEWARTVRKETKRALTLSSKAK